MNASKVAIIGGGSFATALVKIFSNNTNTIRWWLRSPETVAFIGKYHHNPNYLTDVNLDLSKITLSSNIKEVIADADIIVLAVPSAFLVSALKEINPDDLKDKMIVSGIKGIVPEHNLIIGDYINQHFNVRFDNIAVITGPCHAEEVALERLSYLTVASKNKENNSRLATLMRCRYIRITESDDVYGTEYSAVMKNIMAVASGVCHGLGYGDNFQAVLISNASREIKRFIDAVHPITRDINDSAYLGDLLVTAYSQFSRNRMFGNMLGKGYSVKFAQLEMNMIAEGFYAAKCIDEINKKYEVNLPISKSVYNICYEKISPRVEMKLLTDQLN
ncbi:MAG: NAD(P)H-dependent glycerol-3-phosphate dehydrogenase [Bacteroidia bacterium]